MADVVVAPAPAALVPIENSSAPVAASAKPQQGDIWWSNAIFFVGMHVLALVGVLRISPYANLDRRTALVCFLSWQLAQFGITLGYHRLWSHKAYTASFALRCVLAGMGCLGFQGSIKYVRSHFLSLRFPAHVIRPCHRWWVLRHRLHHRFTDTESDPYNAGKGLLFSHMGWIFRKPNYPRMGLIDRKARLGSSALGWTLDTDINGSASQDLNIDPVVRFQHKYYIPLTLALGFGLPTAIGWTYGDALGAFIWGGVSRLFRVPAGAGDTDTFGLPRSSAESSSGTAHFSSYVAHWRATVSHECC